MTRVRGELALLVAGLLCSTGCARVLGLGPYGPQEDASEERSPGDGRFVEPGLGGSGRRDDRREGRGGGEPDRRDRRRAAQGDSESAPETTDSRRGRSCRATRPACAPGGAAKRPRAHLPCPARECMRRGRRLPLRARATQGECVGCSPHCGNGYAPAAATWTADLVSACAALASLRPAPRPPPSARAARRLRRQAPTAAPKSARPGPATLLGVRACLRRRSAVRRLRKECASMHCMNGTCM